VQIELVGDGVGADDASYLASLASSLATYSHQLTTSAPDNTTSDVTGQGDDVTRRLSASDLAALVRGVSGLASARTQFTATPCTYDELQACHGTADISFFTFMSVST